METNDSTKIRSFANSMIASSLPNSPARTAGTLIISLLDASENYRLEGERLRATLTETMAARDKTPARRNRLAEIEKRRRQHTPEPLQAWRDFADHMGSDVSVESIQYRLAEMVWTLVDDRIAAADDIDTLLATVDHLQTMLEDLTPGGSEFFDSPGHCVQWVRDRMAHVGALAKERNEARDEVKQFKRQHDALLAIVEVCDANIKAAEAERDQLRKELEAAKAATIASAPGWFLGAVNAMQAQHKAEVDALNVRLTMYKTVTNYAFEPEVFVPKPEPSPEENAAAAARLARIDEMIEYWQREVDAWPVYAQVEYEKLIETQNEYEAKYC